MGEYWKAVEAVTGYPIADLPNFTTDSLPWTLGRAETFTGTLPINPADPSAPENWIAASDPWCVAILRIDEDTNTCIGGGYINGRTRTQGDTVTVPLVTFEGYLDRRQIGDYAPTATDQNVIASQLVTLFAVTPSAAGLNGWPASFNIIGGAGMARDRTYATTDRKTVLGALTELSGVEGGPEWMVTIEHLSGPERWLPVFNVGARMGAPATAGLAPAVSFELGGTEPGGTVTDFSYVEDFTDGKGANYVTAYGTTDATSGLTPQQSLAYTGNARQLQLDHAWNPSTSITDTLTLLQHAQQQLPLMQQGSRSLALAIQGNVYPRAGIDFDLGDDVRYQLGGLDKDGHQTVPSVPGGIEGVSRIIGWQRNDPDGPSPVTIPVLGGV